MAKKKASANPKTIRVRASALNVRCMPEYKEWVDQLAVADRCTLVEVIDRALVAYAKKIKFPNRAPRR